jgi:hypothetical protein
VRASMRWFSNILPFHEIELDKYRYFPTVKSGVALVLRTHPVRPLRGLDTTTVFVPVQICNLNT